MMVSSLRMFLIFFCSRDVVRVKMSNVFKLHLKIYRKTSISVIMNCFFHIFLGKIMDSAQRYSEWIPSWFSKS